MASWLRLLAAITALATLGIQRAGAALGGQGADTPWYEMQAEDAVTTGTIIGPDYTYNTIACESSGRRAVTLAAGQYVEFTVPTFANSIVVRYSIPDSADGSAYQEFLSLQIGTPFVGAPTFNWVSEPALPLTNAYSHYYGAYPFSNKPSDGNHFHYYDEVSALTSGIGPGSKVRLTNTSNPSVTIDFADFESVPPALAQPPGSISVTSFVGGDPNGNDAAPAFQNAINLAASQNGIVWVPPGFFRLRTNIQLVDNVTIMGAGMWYSTVYFANPLGGGGFQGGYYNGTIATDSIPPVQNVNIHDLKILGNVNIRDDAAQSNAVGGKLTTSVVHHVWVEHFKAGAWLFGPGNFVDFNHCRMRDLTADGINFNGVLNRAGAFTNGAFTNSNIEYCHFRNTGDDGAALWSLGVQSSANAIHDNTIELPLLANGIGIYGGTSNAAYDNLVIDAGLKQGGGIHVANRFSAQPLAGTTSVFSNTIIRSGNSDPGFLPATNAEGALWFDARDSAITGTINVWDTVIRQSPYSAIQFISFATPQNPINNVNFNDVAVKSVGTYWLDAVTSGSATFNNIAITGTVAGAQMPWTPPVAFFAISDCGQFNAMFGSGNTNINSAGCFLGNPRTPNFPAPSDINIGPKRLDFFTGVPVGQTRTGNIAVTNNGNTPVTVNSIRISGGDTSSFTQTNTCGSSIAAHSTGIVSVVFKPRHPTSLTTGVNIDTSEGYVRVLVYGTGI